MKINSIKITNFKSCYGTQEFDFNELNGLVKLSGPIGSGKTLIVEALQWGLLGTVKGQSNPSLIAWNTQACEVEISLESKGKQVRIKRNICEPLVVEIDGKQLIASNKRNTQSILEEDIYDVPKLAILKMCLISFNGFSTLANMNPAQTKEFIDEIFGFKLFSEYNIILQNEKKSIQNNIIKLTAMHEDNIKNIEKLKEKQAQQKIQLATNFDLKKLVETRNAAIESGKSYKEEKNTIDQKYKAIIEDLEKQRIEFYKKKNECATLGKQEKSFINTFKNGVCPTCGNSIQTDIIEQHKAKMLEYANQYKIEEANENSAIEKLNSVKSNYNSELESVNAKINDLKNAIAKIDSEMAIYTNNLKLIDENYDDLINTHKSKIEEIENQLKNCDNDMKEWNSLEELLTKTLRYNLLNSLIPHINKSINYFIDRLDQPYRVEFDQEFKCHIYTESFENEISYNNLSTGQKKTIDIAIIFGILKNIISNVEMNVIILDELMSNMDSDARNVMLSVLKDSLGEDKTIFIVNHAEMNDDYFDHKIRVSLKNKRIKAFTKKREESRDAIVRASQYEQIF